MTFFFFKKTLMIFIFEMPKNVVFVFLKGVVICVIFLYFFFDKKAVEREKCPIEIWLKKDLNVFFYFLYHKI